MDEDGIFLREAERLDQQLRAIRRALQRAYDADRSRVNLTPPQEQAMTLLVEALREGQADMTIGALSQRMGLAQSTVSGLVLRLERKGMVARAPDPADRRYTRIHLTEPVQAYLAQAARVNRLGPLVGALQQASPDERQAILEGLDLLARLLLKS